MSRRWRRLIPLAFTLAALAAGFGSLLCAAAGAHLRAAQLIMLSMILDGLDGNLARLLRGTSRFGAELDTFVDMISFGVAPAFLVHQAVLGRFGLWGLALVLAIVISGAWRLARFRVVDPFRGARGFLGLPITVNAGWLAMFVFVTESGLFEEARFSLATGPLATLVWTCTVMFVILQVSHIRYGKPTKTPVLFMTSMLFVLFLFLRIRWAVASALAMCAGLFFYAFISPFLPRHQIVLDLDDEEEEDPAPVRHL